MRTGGSLTPDRSVRPPERDESAPRVSVILPVYNGMPFLPAAVESIRSQSLVDWELVLVNDGSSDGSTDYLGRVAAADSRLVLVTHDGNRGIGAAYNSGLRTARGRYVAFQEQDDVSLPGRLARQLEILDHHRMPIVSTRVGLLDEAGALYDTWPNDLSCEMEITPPGYRLSHQILVSHTNIANATLMIDREALGPGELEFDEQFRRCCQDADLQMRLFHRHPSLRLAEILVHMRRSGAHRSATSEAKAMVPDMRRLLAKHGPGLFRTAPVVPALRSYLRAWSTQYRFEAGCHRGSPAGWGLALASAVLWPGNPRIWDTIRRAGRPETRPGHPPA